MQAARSRDEAAPAIDPALSAASDRERGGLQICALVGIAISLAVAFVTFLTTAIAAIDAREFADESEYLVAAQMIVNGSSLYKDILMQHGPIPVMIAHFYAALIDKADFSYFRVTQILLVIGSCLALFTSPVFRTWTARALASAVYLALLWSVWLHYRLNMVLYQSIGGYLFVIVLAQCIAPLYFRASVTRNALLVGGIAFSLAVFCAYPFILVGCLLFVSYLLIPRGTASLRTHGKPFLVGAAIGTSLVLMWLAIFGDIVGYAIYHFYFNQAVYAAFIDYSPGDVLKNLALTLDPANLVPLATLAMVAVWICIFIGLGAKDSHRADWATRLLCVALILGATLFTNARGHAGFHSAPLLITNFALFSIAVAALHQRTLARTPSFAGAGVFASSIAAVLVMRCAVVFSTQWNGPVRQAHMSPGNGETYDFVRSITKAEGDLLVLPYHPIVYVRAGRLPASAAFFYLPWHAAYAKDPVKGYEIDICADIRTRKPAVIWFYNWRVWDKYSLESYEPCLLSIMTSQYAPIQFNSSWHVRKDILDRRSIDAPRDGSADSWDAIERSMPAEGSSTLSLDMTPEHLARPTPLERIGVLIAPNDASRAGDATLVLRGPNGAEFSTPFQASNAQANEYHYLALPPDIYTLGEIRVGSGSSIAVWADSRKHACLIYEYVGGSRGYTPECPIAGAWRRASPPSPGVRIATIK